MAYIPRDEALEHPMRRALVDAVRDAPGITLGELAEAFDVTPSTILWHSRKLAGADLVRMERHGPHRLFFTADTGRDVRDEALRRHHLRSDEARAAFHAVQGFPGATVRHVARQVGLAMPRARQVLRRLVDKGLLEARRAGRALAYFPTPGAAGQ